MSGSTNQTQSALEAAALKEVVWYMQPPLLTLCFEFLFFGVNFVLSAAYLLLHLRQKEKRTPFYPLANLIMFIFATAGLIVSVFDVLNEFKILIAAWFTNLTSTVTKSEQLLVNYRTPIGILYPLANIVADFVLIYRCYIVWGSRKRIIALPTFISIANGALALAASGLIKVGSDHLFATQHDDRVSVADKLDYVFLGVNIFENVLLTCLIAGRIWWISKSATKIFGSETDKRFNAIVAMFLESGFIYPVALIPCLVVQATGSVATMDPILLQIVGIAPSLILLRTALGISIENNGGGAQQQKHDIETNTKVGYPGDGKAELCDSETATATAHSHGTARGSPFVGGTTTLASTVTQSTSSEYPSYRDAARSKSPNSSLRPGYGYGYNRVGAEHSHAGQHGQHSRVMSQRGSSVATSEPESGVGMGVVSEKEGEARLEPVR